jgi:pilus assembly protein CpaC
LQEIKTARAQLEKLLNIELLRDPLEPKKLPQFLKVEGLQPGTTLLTVISVQDEFETISIVVLPGVAFIRKQLQEALPTSNINPVLGPNNTLILSGTVSRIEDVEIALRIAMNFIPGSMSTSEIEQTGVGSRTVNTIIGADRVINALRVGGVQHVQLCVVLARVNRTEERTLGVSFLDNGNRHFLTSTVGGPGAHAGEILPGTTTSSSLLTGDPNLIFGLVNDRQGFLGVLNALRQEGIAKLLSEPRLVTLSGQEAYIVSGGETPILTASFNGPTVSYKTFGTVLHFLPIVSAEGRILLQVRPEVSNRNQANDVSITSGIGTTVVPGFDTQTAWVVVEMEPGQTLAIGGLITHRVNGTTRKVPVLGDLPFIGTAFSFKNFREEEEELVILVTPHLVSPMSCDQLPKLLPGQETRSPDDFELFLEGILEAPRGPREICQGHHYVAAYKNGPTAGQYPCAGHVPCGKACGRTALPGPNAACGIGALPPVERGAASPNGVDPRIGNMVPGISNAATPAFLPSPGQNTVLPAVQEYK